MAVQWEYHLTLQSVNSSHRDLLNNERSIPVRVQSKFMLGLQKGFLQYTITHFECSESDPFVEVPSNLPLTSIQLNSCSGPLLFYEVKFVSQLLIICGCIKVRKSKSGDIQLCWKLCSSIHHEECLMWAAFEWCCRPKQSPQRRGAGFPRLGGSFLDLIIDSPIGPLCSMF